MIIGATGQIGAAVLRLAAASPALDVVAAVRSPAKAAALGVPTVLMDLDRPETLAPALHGIDRVFLMTGYTIRMFKQSRDFLNAARRADVEHIVHLGAPGDDDTQAEHWLWHQFVERYIEWSGFSFTHLRPDIFMQNLLGYGGEKLVASGVIRHYVANTRLTWIDGEDVAAVAVECLSKPEDHAEKTYRLGAEVRSYTEIAELLTRVVGKPYVSESLPPDGFLAKALAAGADSGYMQAVLENYMAYADGTRKGEEKLFSHFLDVTGRKPASVEDFIRRHLDVFAY
jgi:NAD(P)H dehydrogenase (quinone)